jgi:protein SCO1/2
VPHALRTCAVMVLLIAAVTTLRVMTAAASEPETQLISPSVADGAFTLTNTDGALVNEKTYRGKWLLIYFGYTFCPDICPTTLNDVAGALEELGPRAGKVQPIFITIDTKRDTRQILADYVKSFDPRIVALTGTQAQTAAAARAYGVIYERQDGDDGDYLYDHTSYVYLMDPEAKFVEAFAGSDDREKIGRRLSQLIEGEKNGSAPAN